eukprot:CAMPEP_0185251028 /NCGR_PEP_ID=MMETSP1359-20130426/185_1 /TAXON_ID=552665 /ORGANISM="Bigelowiella longifila, Strain CCMP242" /LENGTH=39 /DNA_ID= /DNA_START= /DNA_END= /DNA_ORIENTATION=
MQAEIATMRTIRRTVLDFLQMHPRRILDAPRLTLLVRCA